MSNILNIYDNKSLKSLRFFISSYFADRFKNLRIFSAILNQAAI